jgi:hypothetical protein
MRSLLIFFYLFGSFLLAKSIKISADNVEGLAEVYYNRCISSLYNHPLFLHASGGIQMGDQLELMGELDQYCHCHGREDLLQRRLYDRYNMGYFFINKKEYLAGLDICLQENVSQHNREEFFKVLSLIKIAPIIGQELARKLAGRIPQSVTLRGKGPSLECLEEKLMGACRENQSLYFLFRCFKRKLKKKEFLDESYIQCL